MGDFPGLVERDGRAQISPGDFLAHEAQRENVATRTSHLLGKRQGSQAEFAPLLQHVPGEALHGVGFFVECRGDGADFLRSEIMRYFLQFFLVGSE